MKKILVIFGTRPEAIKMCPLILELKKSNVFELKLCVTGQHETMVNDVLIKFKIRPDYDLSIMKKDQDLFYISNTLMEKVKFILEKEKPDLTLVHGDTTTSYISALCCFYLKMPIGHIEAGLRTNNIFSPFPEEFNRKSIDLISSIDFAPTIDAKNNLAKEGKKSSVFVTGNTGIDSLKYTIQKSYNHKELIWAKDSKLILMTAHRRENIGSKMASMFKGLRMLLEKEKNIKIIYPVHLNPRVRKIAYKEFKNCPNIHLIEPLNVFDFHNFLNASYFVITDSGGIQEEACSLHKPVLVMRESTERSEGVKTGAIRLIGTESQNIYKCCRALIHNKNVYKKMAKSKNPYGSGNSSRKITKYIIEWFNK